MYKLIIGNQRTNTTYDVSTLASNIEHFTSILGQAGKLTFILEKDPNNILQLCEGNIVIFSTDEGGVFYGYIFTVGTDASEAYKVTAYDQTRYLKNKDTMFVENKTINGLFQEICARNGTKNFISKVQSPYVLQPKLHNDKTYFQMLESAISETQQFGDNNPYFFIRDNFGVLELNELKATKTDYVIGDESLLTDYRYEVDIDKDTFNRIKIMSGSEKQGITLEHIEQDEKSIAEIGVLQQLLTVDVEADDAKIQNYAKLCLKLKNRTLKTIQLDAIGVQGLNAGDGFSFRLKKLGIVDYGMFILSATHRYGPDLHTMSLEVSGFSSINDEIKKPVSVIVAEVMKGLWGDGEIRKNNLTEAGYNYYEIQSEVNKLYEQGV